MFENVEWTAFKFWLDLVSTVAVFVFFIWTAIKQKQKDNGQDIKQLREDQQTLSSRVQKLENTQELSPTHDDLSAVEIEMNGLKEQLKAQNNLLHTIHEFLLNDKRS